MFVIYESDDEVLICDQEHELEFIAKWLKEGVEIKSYTRRECSGCRIYPNIYGELTIVR